MTGGGLKAGSANRVLAVKKWREAVFTVEVPEKAWRAQQLMENVLDGLDDDIARERERVIG